MNRIVRWMAAAAVATLPFVPAAQADIQITTCTFPKLNRSLIMPEVKVLFDTGTGRVTVEDALIREVVGKPQRAAVEERPKGGKNLFIVR